MGRAHQKLQIKIIKMGMMIIDRRQMLVKQNAERFIDVDKQEMIVGSSTTNKDDTTKKRSKNKNHHHSFVQFNDDVIVHEIEMIDSSFQKEEEEENDKRWYNQHDYDRFNDDVKACLSSYKKSTSGILPMAFDEMKYCIRGIQRFDNVSYKNLVRKVLSEQQKQRAQQQQQMVVDSSGVPTSLSNSSTSTTETSIRELSMMHTKGDRYQALKRAQSYAKEEQKQRAKENQRAQRKKTTINQFQPEGILSDVYVGSQSHLQTIHYRIRDDSLR